MSRVVPAILVLSLLTAFAPAPFPRTERTAPSNEISLDALQGTWRVVSMRRTRSNGQHLDHKWATTAIRIQKDQWAFMGNGNASNTYSIAVDGSKKPAALDWFTEGNRQQGVRGLGIVRRVGRRVEIVYYFGGSQRATSFESFPDNLWYLTLER